MSTDFSTVGHALFGSGALRVVVMNDWLCDTSTWEAARLYADGERFTYAFADLRGYGRSRDWAGEHTLVEAASDVLALADSLGWRRFAVVGHSMSSLVALHLGQTHPDRIERVVALTPPPPTGFGADEAALDASRALAMADDATRASFFAARADPRFSPGWARFKAARWRATAAPEAAAAYVAMFARDGLPDRASPIVVPVLAITGEHDAPPMRAAAVERALGALCVDLVVTPLAESGHYPMLEMPPLTVALVERFLSATR